MSDQLRLEDFLQYQNEQHTTIEHDSNGGDHAHVDSAGGDNAEQSKPTPEAPPAPGGLDLRNVVHTDTNFDEPGPPEGKKNLDPGNVSKHSKIQGKMAAKFTDLAGSSILSGIAGSKTRGEYKADDEDMEDLIEIWSIYIEASGKDIPPGAMLLLIIGTIYLAKIPHAISERKKNKPVTKPRPEKRTETVDDIQDVEVEEISEDDIDLQNELYHINTMAKEAGIPELKNYKVKPGFCKYAYVVLGEKIPVAHEGTTFADQGNSARWANVSRQYKKAGVPLPQMLQ